MLIPFHEPRHQHDPEQSFVRSPVTAEENKPLPKTPAEEAAAPAALCKLPKWRDCAWGLPLPVQQCECREGPAPERSDNTFWNCPNKDFKDPKSCEYVKLRSKTPAEENAAKAQSVPASWPQGPELLKAAYAEYISVKQCFEARRGYLAVNISEPEMLRAKMEIAAIEKKLNVEHSDDLWKSADTSHSKVYQMNDPRLRDACQMQLATLDNVYKTLIPEANFTHKDF